MPAPVEDSTHSPISSGLGRICPECRASAPEGATWDAQCAKHGRVFVEARALSERGNDPLLGRTLAGRFTVLSRIGSGSMGAVYRARQAIVGRDVALKIVRRDRAYDPETKARFEREARAVSLLKSPHTVTAFDFGEAEDGSWFLALEMLEGETLGDRLRRERRLHWVDALRFAREALRSLAEAHAQGIIHRDLKPDNLFIARAHDPRGDHEICKILDFGIAKWIRDEDSPVDQLETLAGTVFGTPRYMSPEQAQGAALDARSDLYSLGVLLFQMLAGRAPFTDDDAVVVMARHIKDPPPLLAEVAPGVEVPAPVEAAVRRALEKTPELRAKSAEEMLSELEQVEALSRAVESGVRPHVAEDDLPESLRLAERRTLVLGALLAAALLLLVAVSWVRWGGQLKRWSGAPSAAAAVITHSSSSLESIAAVRPNAPTPAPSESLSLRLENSVSIASPRVVEPEPEASNKPTAAPAGSSVRALHAPPPTKRVVPKSAASLPLERRGNERYGRFE